MRSTCAQIPAGSVAGQGHSSAISGITLKAFATDSCRKNHWLQHEVRGCQHGLMLCVTQRLIRCSINNKIACSMQAQHKVRLWKGCVRLMEFRLPISLFISAKYLSSSNMNSISSVSMFHYSCDNSSLAYPTAYKLLAFFEVTLWIAKWKSYKEWQTRWW